MPHAFGKTEALIASGDVVKLDSVPVWNEIPADKYALCAMRNNTFEAVAVAFDEREFNRFVRDIYSGRTKTWLLMDKKLARRVSYCP